MKFKISDPSKTMPLVKEILWRAYDASSCKGLGFLQRDDNATIDSVWEACASNRDYGGGSIGPNKIREDRLYADYVFGRMMKISINYNPAEGSIEIGPDMPRSDYQSWSRRFETPADLVDAALEGFPGLIVTNEIMI